MAEDVKPHVAAEDLVRHGGLQSYEVGVAPQCVDEAGGGGAVEVGGRVGGEVAVIERGADVVGTEVRGLVAVAVGLRAMA